MIRSYLTCNLKGIPEENSRPNLIGNKISGSSYQNYLAWTEFSDWFIFNRVRPIPSLKLSCLNQIGSGRLIRNFRTYPRRGLKLTHSSNLFRSGSAWILILSSTFVSVHIIMVLEVIRDSFTDTKMAVFRKQIRTILICNPMLNSQNKIDTTGIERTLKVKW